MLMQGFKKQGGYSYSHKQEQTHNSKRFCQNFNSFSIDVTLDSNRLMINLFDNKQELKYFKEYNQDYKNQQFHPKVNIQDIFISISCTKVQQLKLKQFYDSQSEAQSIKSNKNTKMQDMIQNWMDCFFTYDGYGVLIVQVKILDLRTKKFVNYESRLSLKKEVPIQSVKNSDKEQNIKSQSTQKRQKVISHNKTAGIEQSLGYSIPQFQKDNIQQKEEENIQEKKVIKLEPGSIFEQQINKQQDEKSNTQIPFQILNKQLLQQVNQSSKISLDSSSIQVNQQRKKFMGKRQKLNDQERDIFQQDLLSQVDKNWSDISFASYLPFQNLENMTIEQKLQKIKQIHGVQVYEGLKQKIRQDIQQQKKRKRMTLQQKRNNIQQLFDKYYQKVKSPEQKVQQNLQQQLDQNQIEEYEQKFKSEYDKIDDKFLEDLKQMLVKRKNDVQNYYQNDYYNQLDEGYYQENQNGKKVNQIRNRLLKAKILKKTNK